MDPGQLEENPAEPKENNKRKTRDYNFKSSFKVTRGRGCVDAQKQTFLLLKPDIQSGIPDIIYPTVCLKEESVEDKHAFHIMHDLNHINILSMKVFYKSKDSSSVMTVVEKNDGSLWSICDPVKCLRRDGASNKDNISDRINHISSPKLQDYLRQIVLGLDFLRKNGLYHGNLSWESTLYKGTIVKLAGFKSKEPMNGDDAYWEDWLCFLKMLERISHEVNRVNQLSPDDIQYYCRTLDSLINMLKQLDRTSLPTIVQTVLEHIFFWNLERRIKYFAHKISLKLTDESFMKRVMKSGIRGNSWDTDCSLDFEMLVHEMNEFRKKQKKKKKSHEDRKGKAHFFSRIRRRTAHHCINSREDENLGTYNGDSLKDYIRVICGAYTHWRAIKLDVDGIIRENHPTIFSDVEKLCEASDKEDSSKQTPQSGEHGLQGYQNQGHGVASLLGRSSHSQRGYRYPPRGRPPRSNPPGGYLEQSPDPPRGGMGWNQRQSSIPYHTQPPSYHPGPRNYISYDQYVAPGYVQLLYPHNGAQQNYGQGYTVPGYNSPPLPSSYFVPSPMTLQHSFYQAPPSAQYSSWSNAQHGNFDESHGQAGYYGHFNESYYGQFYLAPPSAAYNSWSNAEHGNFAESHGQAGYYGHFNESYYGQHGQSNESYYGQHGHSNESLAQGPQTQPAYGDPLAHGQAEDTSAAPAAGQPAHGQGG